MRGLEGNMQAEPRAFAHDAVLVSPSNTVDIANTSDRGCCLYIGDISAGADVKVKMEGGGEVTFKNVTAGSFLPILVTRVFATGTTAQQILALY